jgi:hypothetical protein
MVLEDEICVDGENVSFLGHPASANSMKLQSTKKAAVAFGVLYYFNAPLRVLKYDR